MRTERRVGTRAVLTALAVTLALPGLALPAAPRQETPTAVLELSLQEAIELALRHNLQVRILSLNPDLSEEQIRFQRGAFDTVLTFSLPQAFQRSTQPGSSALSGADVLTSEQVSAGFVIGSRTGFGLNWSFAGSAQRSVTNNQFSTFNPQYNTSLNLQVRQPLLQGFGEVANQQQLLVARNNYAVSEEAFRQQLQNQLFQVIFAYWNLVSSFRTVDIAQQSLELAEEQLSQSQTRVRIGTLAAVDVIQNEQQVAAAELSVIQAEIALRNQEDQLKQLLNLDAVVPEGWDVTIIPTEEPATTAEPIDVDEAVAEALRRNPQLVQDRIQVASSQINLDAARNGLLPQLDFVGNVTANGLGGDQIFRSGLFGGGVTEIQEGGISDSLQQLLSGDFRNWSLGLQLSFPVRNDQARAVHAQASIQERQALMQVQERELLIRMQVRQAARNVIGGAQSAEAAREATDLAEQQYTAELRRFQQGFSSTFQVLNFQRLLTTTQRGELLSQISLSQALATFHLAKGTLLDWLGIRVDDAGTGGPMMQPRSPDPVEAAAARAAEEIERARIEEQTPGR